MNALKGFALLPLAAALMIGCASERSADPKVSVDPGAEYYGTREPWAREAIYFVMTDRFVDGDSSNNFEDQGGDHPSWEGRLQGPDGEEAFIGYMGGDFRGLLNNADYIRDLGFTSVWVTPIIDNPDAAFSGGDEVTFGGSGDGGKTGYHGYWGVNFFKVDEHLESDDLSFADLTQALEEEYGLKLVLDIVANHGSPAWGMDEPHGNFGQIYGPEGELLADHGNVHPNDLDPASNPLQRWFLHEPDIAELASLDPDNPEVMDYFVNAYLQWIEQGAAAFRIDTIKHQPHHFWKEFVGRIRAEHPDFFMFGESWSYEAAEIAEHTYPENGGVSVIDFPGRQHMTQVFENPGSDFAEILGYLYLENSPYQNPYELATFYDNHDMSRLDADTGGYMSANNWLFTARGIPVVYYGSEIGFQSGLAEHYGNRNYYGEENIARAEGHPIAEALRHIAHIRQQSVALQKGLQVNLDFAGDTAAFLRVYQVDGVAQTALVLLNKGDRATAVTAEGMINTGRWEELGGDAVITVDDTGAHPAITLEVPAHGVRVLAFNEPVNNPALAARLEELRIPASPR
ncbi:alpha-amylase family glycosyl hydrolase [Marinimicrobium alkaliphilum]|uniref:alpha-amylase family glycosyl hydrolase n=1 Tax=Marinimicrobium alkaliphilum TaxID=2202654 RepID=UPI000DB9DCB7|nr:alpha-amylase family glycosyl hydrolase [Marinimicrobium alkaliphilum]